MQNQTMNKGRAVVDRRTDSHTMCFCIRYLYVLVMIIFASSSLRAVGTRGARGATAPPLLLKFHQNSFKMEVFA